jgi:N-formylglutamate amidohydrolase
MPLFEIAEPNGPVISCAIHAGHDMRPSLLPHCLLDDATRRREEDPYTDQIAEIGTGVVRVHRSRFEVDLNRPRDKAVYRTPDEAWGLSVWDGELPNDEVAASLVGYDTFYSRMELLLERTVAAHGAAVVFDVHSYNHRRGGPDAPPEAPDANPEVNLGTGTLRHDRWGDLVSHVLASMNAADIDARENVRFKGGHLSAWAHERFDGAVCVLSFEFKKVFMDEWTGVVDRASLERSRLALAECVSLAEAAAKGQL